MLVLCETGIFSSSSNDTNCVGSSADLVAACAALDCSACGLGSAHRRRWLGRGRPAVTRHNRHSSGTRNARRRYISMNIGADRETM